MAIILIPWAIPEIVLALNKSTRDFLFCKLKDFMQNKPENDNSTEVFAKAAKYCAYQERCQAEVRTKLKEWGQFGLNAEEIIAKLIENKFLNEERFAKAFAGGKFRVKHWGRNKIRQELKLRQISEFHIKQAFKEIDEGEYKQILKKLVISKIDMPKEKNVFVRRNKTALHLITKGYEPELVWDIIREIS